EILRRVVAAARARDDHVGEQIGVAREGRARGIKDIERVESVGGQSPGLARVHLPRVKAVKRVALLAPGAAGDGGVLAARIDQEYPRVTQKVGDDGGDAL